MGCLIGPQADQQQIETSLDKKIIAYPTRYIASNLLALSVTNIN